MQRHLDQELLKWFEGKPRKPLILRGARQVGKSSLVRNFARAQGLELDEINLELHIPLDHVFKSLQIEAIEAELSAVLKRPVGRPNAILFLDEIQATPHALAALRYFFELRPDIPVIAAGSLLEFVLQDANFSMPVGRVEFLNVEPMSFEEFLDARNESFLVEKLHTFHIGAPWPQTLHAALTEQLRTYFMVGGMPEAVAAFIAQPQGEAWSNVQESILQTYKQDFTKYSSKNRLMQLHEVFARLPGYTGRKVKYSELAPDQRSQVTKEVIDLLTFARVIRKVYHSSGQGIPLGAQALLQHFRLFFLDVGLVSRGLGVLPTSRLFHEATIFEGPLAEQFVAQHLAVITGGRRVPELYYWQREQKQSNAEVDFLMQHDRWIVPIEVKAGATGHLKSLQQFMVSHPNSPTALKLAATLPTRVEIDAKVLTNEGSKSCHFKLVTLPLYMAEQINRLLAQEF